MKIEVDIDTSALSQALIDFVCTCLFVVVNVILFAPLIYTAFMSSLLVFSLTLFVYIFVMFTYQRYSVHAKRSKDYKIYRKIKDDMKQD